MKKKTVTNKIRINFYFYRTTYLWIGNNSRELFTKLCKKRPGLVLLLFPIIFFSEALTWELTYYAVKLENLRLILSNWTVV